MNFWAKLALGLNIAGQVLAAAFALEAVGGEANLPDLKLQIQERKFDISIKVKRVA
jgi:hypothetical protein